MTSQTRQLFGTDGIRGVAGEFPLTSESTYLIGRALGHDLLRVTKRPRVVIGQDTRESSAWIADRIALGLSSCGVEVHSAGVITTPGIAFLARSRGYAAGVVISASHNPWTDNGIKVFSNDGYKLPDARELAIEQEIFALLQDPQAHPEPEEKPPASLPGEANLRHAYIGWLAKSVNADSEKDESRGGLRERRSRRRSAGIVSSLRHQSHIFKLVAGWSKYQRGLRSIASRDPGQNYCFKKGAV